VLSAPFSSFFFDAAALDSEKESEQHAKRLVRNASATGDFPTAACVRRLALIRVGKMTDLGAIMAR
jgi:hypothetical protein